MPYHTLHESDRITDSHPSLVPLLHGSDRITAESNLVGSVISIISQGKNAIAAKYQELGGAAGWLGAPVGEPAVILKDLAVYQHFQNGAIYWGDADTGAHTVCGAIRDKWVSLGGENSFLGYPVTDETTTPDGVGRYNLFQGGSIYWTPGTGAHEVHGAIGGLWSKFGCERSFLGYPLTDETVTPDGIGRYNHFQGGSIYWSPSTGAHCVYGAIRDKWASLGWERSWLGYPTSDEQDFSEGGRVSTFERGAIYWWPDTGAIEMGNICVRYKGLACFSTTFGSGSDEPYAILGVVPAPPTAGSSVRTVIYNGVDGGDSREDDIELYRGLPYGLSLSVALMEHDAGDPDKYRKTVEESVKQGSSAVAAAVGTIPYVGPYLAPIAKVFLEDIGPDIVEEINSLLGTDDDYVGSASFFVSGKDMVTMARAEPKNFRGIVWHMDSPLISGDGADYKAYIGIWAV